jgi:predicted SAM-dependent methyltransferase
MSNKLLKSSKKINFGCGTNVLDGFINVDLIARKNVYPHNVTKSFPLEDNSIEAIYTEHMIEHLTLQEVLFFLKDCYRLMQSGAPIRIATPNLKNFIPA